LNAAAGLAERIFSALPEREKFKALYLREVGVRPYVR
jgi:hypothetical protein